MKVDHIGYAVKDIGKARKQMEALGYTFEETIEDPDRQIDIAFGEADGYRVELVAPKGEGSPVDTQLSRIGPTPYHLCYRSGALEEDIGRLQRERFRVTVPPAPAVAFGGKRVVFLYSLAIGLIEIVEE